MRILLANKYFYPRGGSETVFFEERAGLKRMGHEVIEFSMQHPANIASPFSPFFAPNIDFRRTEDRPGIAAKIGGGFRFIHNSKAASRIGALVRHTRPQIAHLHNIYHQLTPAIIPVLKKAGLKVIMTLHDYKVLCPSYLMLRRGSVCGQCRGKQFWRPAVKRCHDGLLESWLLSLEAYWHLFFMSYEKVDLFLVPSRFLAEQAALRIAPHKLRIVPNGIALPRKPLPGSEDAYIVYCGRISREKGVETLLKAHRRLPTRFPLKIIGDGPLRDSYACAYPEVQFCGRQTGKALAKLLRHAAFVVVPSEWNENCSLTVLEVMALGKPVIASRIGGIPEQIDDMRNGLLFKPGDIEDLAIKMTDLIRDRRLRFELGEAAREKAVALYSIEKHCLALAEIYEKVLSGA